MQDLIHKPSGKKLSFVEQGSMKDGFITVSRLKENIPRYISMAWKRCNWLLLLFVMLSGANTTLYAQAPTISYPAVAQNLIRGYSQGNLTVKLVFNSICSGTVRVAFPASVIYVPGSVSKITGTPGVSISESSISNLSRPEFSISGVAGIGDEITFTIARMADCGLLTTAKDSIYFIAGSGCPGTTEISGSINNYNIHAPALSLTPPDPLTGAVIGNTATRTTTITNGGNGATDTVRFYIVYTGGGVVNTTGTNTITANGVNFAPFDIIGDTLFYEIFGATLFGGNNKLDNAETVTIQEPIRIVKCNANTVYITNWGRHEKSVCNTTKASSAISMAPGVPDLSYAFARVSEGNLCTGDVWQYTLTNTGSESAAGAGSAMSISALLGTNSWSTPALANVGYAWATIGDFNINGVPLAASGTGPEGRTVSFSQLLSDPDGPGGLTDADGDGEYDDLPVGASVVLRYKLIWNCANFPSTCGKTGSDITPNAHFYFRSECGSGFDRYNTIPISTLRYVVGSNNNAVATGPTDIVGTTTFRPKICLNTQGENSWPANSVNGKLKLTFTLPTGVSLSGSGAATVTVDGGMPIAVTATAAGSTVIIERPHLSGFHNLCYELDLSVSCPAASGPTEIFYAFDYLNDPVACPSCVWHLNCASYKVNARCDDCSSGTGVNNNVRTKAERVTLGWTDQTLTTKVNAASVSALALKSLLPYDTVRITQGGVQYPGTSYSNLHYKYGFDAASDGSAFLTFAGGTIRIYKSGSGTTYTCPLPTPVISHPTGHYTWDFSFGTLAGTCLPVGFLFEPADSFSISLLARYTGSNTTGGGLTQLPGTRGYFYNLSGTTELSCGNWGTELYLLPTVISNYATGPTLISGCTSGVANGLSALYYNGGVDYFPEELRPNRYIDSFRVILTAGVGLDNSSNSSLGVVNFNGSTSYYNIAFPVVRGDTLIFKNPGTWQIGDIGRITTYINYRYNIPVKTNCRIEEGNINYKLQMFVRDHYYQYPVTSLAGVPSTAIAPQKVITQTSIATSYGNKPAVSVANLSGVVQGIRRNHFWDVRITGSATTTAPYVWMALEKGMGSGGIVVDSVKLIPSGALITPASIYGTTNKWYKLGTAGLTSGTSQNIRVFFRYSSCTTDSLLFKAGWGCNMYPDPDPSTYPCSISSVYLKLDPLPSEEQLSISRQPGGGSAIPLCTEDSTILILNSAQAANLVGPFVTFFPPAGMSVLTPVHVEYPLGSGNYQDALVTAITGGGYKIDLASHSGIGTKGIYGTASANSTAYPDGEDRQAGISVHFTTDCSFTSGRTMRFNIYGSRPCGSSALGNSFVYSTNRLSIAGASAPGSAGIAMNFGAAGLNCSESTTLSLSTIPTSFPVQAGDTMLYRLPSGLYYNGNFVAGTNCATCSIDVSDGGAGTTLVKVKLHPGVPAGDAVNYSFDVRCDGSGCGAVNINGAFKREIPPLNCNGTTCASSSVIIANGSSPDITLNKPNLVISHITILDTPSWRQANWQANHIKVYYTNNGSMAYTADTDTVEFFCNSTATTPFATRALTKNVLTGASDSDEYYIMMPIGSCAPGDEVVARIQTTTAAGTSQCLCSPSIFRMSGAPLPLGFLETGISAQDCSVRISWRYNDAVLQELNGFEIERSSDGRNYKTISVTGSTMQGHTDVPPGSGNWYYRVKALHHDGSKVYTRTLTAATERCVSARVSVYPNPARSELHIEIQGPGTQHVFEIIDALGRVVKKGGLQANTENTVNLGALVQGIYLIRVISDELVHTQQIQVRR